MNGEITFQFLYAGYHDNLANVVTGYATQILGAIAATVQAIVGLYVLITGYKVMFRPAGASEVMVSRLVRAIVVTFLLSAANYKIWVAAPITTTIPNLLANTLTGAQGLAGAQGFDALLNQIEHAMAQARAQMVGLAYIADRAALWWTGQEAEWVISGCFFIWSLAAATADMLVPIGAMVTPFWLFDATRQWTERWIGKIASLFIVMALTLMLGQIIVFQDAQYIQKFSQTVGAAQANQEIVPNVDVGAAELMFPPVTAGNANTPTINADAAIDMLAKTVIVTLYGLFLLVVVTGIGLYIGGSSGFSAAPAFYLVSAGIGKLTARR